MIGKDASHFAPNINFNLMYLDLESEYRPREQVASNDQKERNIVRFKTVCTDSFKTMSSMVNKIYFDKTPYEIITNLINNASDSATLEYDTQGRSELKIDQLLIPPTTIYNVINYFVVFFSLDFA